MVRTRLRNLERKLVMERAETCIEHEVDNLMLRWDVAQCFGKPIPDSFEFVWRLRDEGFHLPSYSSVINYLSECKHEGKQPDKRRLLQILLPWSRW